MGSGPSKPQSKPVKPLETIEERDEGSVSDKGSVEGKDGDSVTYSEDEHQPEAESSSSHVTKTDEDHWSIDSKDSDDTLGLYCRMRHFNPGMEDSEDDLVIDAEQNADKDNDDSDSESILVDHFDTNLIALIAQENSGVYKLSPNQDNHTHSTDAKKQMQNESSDEDDETSSRENSPKPIDQDPEAYEFDTIGYYIAIANVDAKSIGGNRLQKEQDMQNHIKELLTQDIPEEKPPTPESEQKKTHRASFEELKKIYGGSVQSIPSFPKKKKVSNRQTLVLVKIGNKYKHVAVPTYLPGQKVYKANSIAKNYMHRSAYKPPNKKAAMEMGWDRQRDEETSVLPSPPDSVWGWWSMYNPPQDMDDVSD